MIRLFAAVAIPQEIAEGLARRQQGLPGARWRPLDTLHVTLRYYGAVTEEAAAELDLALAALRGAPLALSLEGCGVFADGGDPRAVWAGVATNAELDRLAARCETAARRTGIRSEGRPFKPHVTLAYLRHAAPPAVAAWVANHNLLKSPPFTIDRFGLYSSWPSSEGSRYDLERDYPLNG